MVDDVSATSESTADEVESVSAAAEEQASSMNQVTSNVSSLVDRAEELQSRLDAFEVREDHESSSPSTAHLQGEQAAPDGGMD